MSASPLERQAEAGPTPWGMALWRLAAMLLYAASLMLIPHDLPAAVFTLMAALLCLPGARAAMRERTGWRVGGAAAASAVMVLLLGVVARAGWPVDAPPSSGVSTGSVVVSTSLASKP